MVIPQHNKSLKDSYNIINLCLWCIWLQRKCFLAAWKAFHVFQTLFLALPAKKDVTFHPVKAQKKSRACGLGGNRWARKSYSKNHSSDHDMVAFAGCVHNMHMSASSWIQGSSCDSGFLLCTSLVWLALQSLQHAQQEVRIAHSYCHYSAISSASWKASELRELLHSLFSLWFESTDCADYRHQNQHQLFVHFLEHVKCKAQRTVWNSQRKLLMWVISENAPQ